MILGIYILGLALKIYSMPCPYIIEECSYKNKILKNIF